MKKLFALLALVTGVASAQSNLQFQGTVATGCSLSVTQNGVLTLNPSNPSSLSTGNSGGSAGTVSVSFVGTPTVSVTFPTSFTSAPSLTFTPNFVGYLTSSLAGVIPVSNNVGSYTYTSGSSDTLNVTLSVTAGAASFPLGNYNATAVVSCS